MKKYQTDKGILYEDYMDCPNNPRDMDEGIFTKFYTFLRRTTSPDECKFSEFADWLQDVMSSVQFKELDADFKEKGFNHDTCGKLVDFAFKRGYVLLPVWKYEHGGVVYRTGIGNPFAGDWDSCIAGVIYCSKADVYKTFGKRCCPSMVLKLNQMMQSEVEEYSHYADGNVYEYLLVDNDGAEDGWYCGFYGDIEENGIKDELGIESCIFLEEV